MKDFGPITTAGDHGAIAIECTYNGNRYHIWCNARTRMLENPTVYKNPPLNLRRSDPGYFTCRKLTIHKGEGKIVGEYLYANSGSAIDAQLVKRAEQQKVSAELWKSEVIDRQIRLAAPEMLALLKEALAMSLQTATQPHEWDYRVQRLIKEIETLKIPVPTSLTDYGVML